MVTESQAKMDEYIEESRVSQKAIIKEIREEKDNKIEQLKKEKEWLINLWGMPYREKIVKDMQQELKEG